MILNGARPAKIRYWIQRADFSAIDFGPVDLAGARAAPTMELAMDRNRILLIGGAMAVALFFALMFASGGILPR